MEALTNQEEVELRSKIEALGLEVTKVPPKSTQQLDEVGICYYSIKLWQVNFLIFEIINSRILSCKKCKHIISN